MEDDKVEEVVVKHFPIKNQNKSTVKSCKRERSLRGGPTYS
jgi:hypothetical protein